MEICGGSTEGVKLITENQQDIKSKINLNFVAVASACFLTINHNVFSQSESYTRDLAMLIYHNVM